MNRDHGNARTAARFAVAAGVLAAPAAQASEGGLVLLPDPVMLPVLVLLFAALVYPVNKLILIPIFRVLDEREEKIAGTRRRAEKLAVEADEVLERYRQAVGEARQDAEVARVQTLEQARSRGADTTHGARAEAEGHVSRAREEMARALEDARTTLRTQSEDLAREIASRALGRSLS